MATGCCNQAIKYSLFVVNFLLLIAGLAVLGFSIYALVSSKSASGTIENGADIIAGGESGFNVGDIYFWISITFIGISSVIVIVSFLGCCGAWKENECLLFSHFLSLVILLMAAVAGAVMLYFQNLDVLNPALISSLKKYIPHPDTETSTDEITSAWDDVQKQFSCCGVNSYKDWTNASIFEYPIFPNTLGHYVPASCCWGLVDETLLEDCKLRPFDQAYVDKMKGCLTQLKSTIETHKDIVGIATLVIIAFLFINLLGVYTFTLCVLPNSGYNQVNRI